MLWIFERNNFLLSISYSFHFWGIFCFSHHMHTLHHKMRSTKCNLIWFDFFFIRFCCFSFVSNKFRNDLDIYFFLFQNDIYTHEFRTREHYLSNMLDDSFFFFFSRGFTCFFSLSLRFFFFLYYALSQDLFSFEFFNFCVLNCKLYDAFFPISNFFLVKWINDLC